MNRREKTRTELLDAIYTAADNYPEAKVKAHLNDPNDFLRNEVIQLTNDHSRDPGLEVQLRTKVVKFEARFGKVILVQNTENILTENDKIDSPNGESNAEQLEMKPIKKSQNKNKLQQKRQNKKIRKQRSRT